MSTIKVTNLQNASAASPAIVLASDSTATLNGLAYPTSGSLSGRNRIINGGFDIWQRATSQSTTGYGSADRWNLAVSGTCTFSQETSVVPSGAQYALKWTTGAASSYGQARQYIEQLNIIPLRGQTLTASAYVRSGGGFTGNIIFEIGYSTSTDASSGSFTVISTTTSGTINSSSYTQIKTTFTVPSNAVGLYVGIVPDVVQGNGATVYQSLVQLEPGSVATPFERRSYGQELMLCQRYYQGASGIPLFAFARTTVFDATATLGLPVTMRAAPTVTISGTKVSGTGVTLVDTPFVHGFGVSMQSNSGDGPRGYSSMTYTASAEL